MSDFMAYILYYQDKKGFTLIEVFLSLALIAVIAGIGAPLYQSFQARNDLDIAAQAMAHSLRRAQSLSQAVDDDSQWGVYIQPGSTTLFKGSDFATRDSTFDEVFSIPTTIMISGVQEVVFEKLTGNPISFGTTTLVNSTNETRNVAINEKGMVLY